MSTVTAYVEWDPETKLFVGIVPGIRGAHTQGATLDELRANLKEVLQLCMEEEGSSIDDLPKFVGLQQVEVAVGVVEPQRTLSTRRDHGDGCRIPSTHRSTALIST